MGLFKFFSTAQRAGLYESRLKALGFDPRSFPQGLHAQICTFAEQRAEQVCDRLKMSGGNRAQHIEQSMYAAAVLLVMCVIGPSATTKRTGLSSIDVIEDAAKERFELGPNADGDTLIISAVEKYVGLHEEFRTQFATAFSSVIQDAM